MSGLYRADVQTVGASPRKSITSVPTAGLTCEEETMSVLIKGMEMPKSCESCPCKTADAFGGLGCQATGYIPLRKVNQDRPDNCPLVEIPPHGRLIDADALIADLKRQCKEVFRIDAVSPDDFWITRNQAYNERLWTTWCESLYDYINTAPAIIEAEENSDD